MIEPVAIHPKALYDDAALCQSVGISPTTLAHARRAGRLRFTRQGKRVLYLGSWLLDWLEATSEPAQLTTPH